MATTQEFPQPHETPTRRRPFSTWMKKLTNFKGSSSSDSGQPSGSRRNAYQIKLQNKKNRSKNNNPYLASTDANSSSVGAANGNRLSFSTTPTGRTLSTSSADRNRRSFHSSLDGLPPSTMETRSNAPTLSTDRDVALSDVAHSHAASSGQDTSATISAMRGPDSTFSSPAPSLRSVTTTLTTIHSTVAPGSNAPVSTQTSSGGAGGHSQHPNSIHFSHQFPSSPGPSALPAHLAPQGSGGHPATYTTATANNLLTDNASILTLASSSKRRRRRSMDTDASVRALAPSSLFGNSRESLPLSVLSSTVEGNTAVSQSALHQARQSVGAPNERASIYSATGTAPALPSERNSYYAGKQNIVGDGGSIKSGLLGHGRADSVSGSIGGIGAAGSPLASAREVAGQSTGRASRRNSAMGENGEIATEPEKAETDRTKQ